MRILAINGSHQGEKGVTQALLKRIAGGAIEAGGEFETVVLARHKINRCLGCWQCQTPERLLHCVYEEQDDVAAIHRRMQAADLILFATPIYVFGMTGLMKTFLDRMMCTADCRQLRLNQNDLLFHHVDPSISSKPFALLITCDNVELETPSSTLAYFRSYSRFHDAPQVGTLVRRAAALLKEDPTGAQFRKCPEILEAFAQAGRELALTGRIRRQTERRATQNPVGIPMMDLLLKSRRFKQKFLENVAATLGGTAT